MLRFYRKTIRKGQCKYAQWVVVKPGEDRPEEFDSYFEMENLNDWDTYIFTNYYRFDTVKDFIAERIVHSGSITIDKHAIAKEFFNLCYDALNDQTVVLKEALDILELKLG